MKAGGDLQVVQEPAEGTASTEEPRRRITRARPEKVGRWGSWRLL